MSWKRADWDRERKGISFDDQRRTAGMRVTPHSWTERGQGLSSLQHPIPDCQSEHNEKKKKRKKKNVPGKKKEKKEQWFFFS